jgi:dTDP-4-amino-4,6-dideoxygalactose transaminase
MHVLALSFAQTSSFGRSAPYARFGLRGNVKLKVGRYNYVSQFGDSIDSLVSDIRSMLLKGRYILCSEVEDFEKAFAAFHGVTFAFGANTGTDALAVALMALGIRPGDEVLTQANTFHATVAAIRIAGAKPTLADADEDTFLIDLSQLDAAITPRTRILMPVHLYGKPTPMASILTLAGKNGLFVVEDAAQAHGARLGGRMVGTFGDVGCYSFHPSKNLAAAGDAGAIITNLPNVAARIDECRALGQKGQNNHVRAGLNSKLDAIQARVLSAKLPHLEIWNQRRRNVARMYRERLAGLPLRFQASDPNEEHVYHLFQIRTDRRDTLLEHLHNSGVDAVIRYPTPIHLQPAFSDFGWRKGQFPVAERLAAELLCLPIRPDLTEAEIDYVSECVHSFYR